MRVFLIVLLVSAMAVSGVAQDQVSLTMSGSGGQLGTRSFFIHGEATLGGAETAILSGGGTFLEDALGGDLTVLVSGVFTLIFPSGGTMVGNFSIPSGILIPPTGNFASAQVTFTVTGGTGKYEGARGFFPNLRASGTSSGNRSGTFDMTGSGTLSVGLRTLSQLAFGGGWYSALYFSNAGTAQATFPVSFIADNGTALNIASVGGSSTNVSIPPGGSVRLEVPNSGPLVQGYVAMVLPEGVTGYGVFRQSVSGIPDQEAVVPLANGGSKSASMTFDDTNYITAAAVVNPSPVATTVTIVAKSPAGGLLGSATVPLAAKNKTALVLRNVPGLGAVAGNRGTVTFSVTTGNVAVLGLRFFGSAFTSIPATDQ